VPASASRHGLQTDSASFFQIDLAGNSHHQPDPSGVAGRPSRAGGIGLGAPGWRHRVGSIGPDPATDHLIRQYRAGSGHILRHQARSSGIAPVPAISAPITPDPSVTGWL
jgi:hypothetical protein